MQWISLRWSLVCALGALCLAITLTLILFAWARQLEQQNATLDLSNRARVRIAATEEGISQAVGHLSSVARFMGAATPASREQFAAFTRPLLSENPHILAFSFQRMVHERDRAAFEASMRQRNPSAEIFHRRHGVNTRAPRQASHRVVDFIEPHERNSASFGLDASSMQGQEMAAARASNARAPASTGVFELVRDGGRAPAPPPATASMPFRSALGFVILTPIYASAAGGANAAPQGYAAALFRTGDMIDHIFRAGSLLNATDLSVQVYGTRDHGASELIYQTRPPSSPQASMRGIAAFLPGLSMPSVKRSFVVAGKPWHIVVSSTVPASGAKLARSDVILIAGGMCALLAALVSHVIANRSRQVRWLVDLRTEELRLANGRLQSENAAREVIMARLNVRQRAIEASANAIVISSAVGPDFKVEYVNPAFERNTGYSAAETVGRNCNFLQGDDRDQPAIAEVRAAIGERRACHVVLRNYRKDGTLFWNDLHIEPVLDPTGAVCNFVAAQYDITAVKAYEAELQAFVNTDTLTGVSNRNLLRDRLSQASSLAARYGHRVWVLFLDLDRFRMVNESLGHKAGNALLVQVAARLSAAVRDTDTVARFGGDKFVLVLDERDSVNLPVVAVKRIMDGLAPGFVADGQEVFLSASLGIAIYPQDTLDLDILVEHAEKAMYRAKQDAGNCFHFYEPGLNALALARLGVESDLRKALEQQQFVLHYQPQVELGSGRVVGVEALIRWQHPDKGMIAPDHFIGIAEECGLILPIGLWVLRTACMQAKAWQRAGLPDLCIAVNLSARQFHQEDLATSVADILAESDLQPQYLELEITESMVMADTGRATALLHQFRAIGIRIAIDDFGTGYSSLAYLRRFPIDVLKIDKSFVRDIVDDADSAAIVALIISLAHSLRLKVIAEGVETEEQLAFLRARRCDQMQGYFFSRPMAADALDDILRSALLLQASST